MVLGMAFPCPSLMRAASIWQAEEAVPFIPLKSYSRNQLPVPWDCVCDHSRSLSGSCWLSFCENSLHLSRMHPEKKPGKVTQVLRVRSTESDYLWPLTHNFLKMSQQWVPTAGLGSPSGKPDWHLYGMT
jgi:hypothetical protein